MCFTFIHFILFIVNTKIHLFNLLFIYLVLVYRIVTNTILNSIVITKMYKYLITHYFEVFFFIEIPNSLNYCTVFIIVLYDT